MWHNWRANKLRSSFKIKGSGPEFAATHNGLPFRSEPPAKHGFMWETYVDSNVTRCHANTHVNIHDAILCQWSACVVLKCFFSFQMLWTIKIDVSNTILPSDLRSFSWTCCPWSWRWCEPFLRVSPAIWMQAPLENSRGDLWSDVMSMSELRRDPATL